MPTFGKSAYQPKEKEEQSFEAVPAGLYQAEVARVLYKPIDLEKTPWLDKLVEKGIEGQVGWAFKITSGPHAKRWIWNDVPAEISDWSGCKLRLYLQELLGGLEELPDDFVFNTDELDQYVGLPCRIRVKQYETKKGEIRNGIDDVLLAVPSQYAKADEFEEAF
jgi:hypothetical protein